MFCTAYLPLYRYAEICTHQGADLDRSASADWANRAVFESRPVFDALIAHLKRSTKLFIGEIRTPMLDPGGAKRRPSTFGLRRGMIALGVAPRQPKSNQTIEVQ